MSSWGRRAKGCCMCRDRISKGSTCRYFSSSKTKKTKRPQRKSITLQNYLTSFQPKISRLMPYPTSTLRPNLALTCFRTSKRKAKTSGLGRKRTKAGPSGRSCPFGRRKKTLMSKAAKTRTALWPSWRMKGNSIRFRKISKYSLIGYLAFKCQMIWGT